ncbi:GrpB family protein [Virgibacillus sp. MG-45]|uniref:GrpB family protein n=1 Tax=Virgibacillus sp. MG-45 TaxID=3102791 RepID=UPI002ED7DBB5
MRFISVVEYDSSWRGAYREEEALVKKILQKELIRSVHIGSTSVPGLKAKPIIDMLLVVQSIERLDTFSKDFSDAGYAVMGEHGIRGRRFFYKGNQERTHHIHAYKYTNIGEIERHVAFRDFLCEHKKIAEQYGELKHQLAMQYPFDSEQYCNEKDSLVKKIEDEALKWYWTVR